MRRLPRNRTVRGLRFARPKRWIPQSGIGQDKLEGHWPRPAFITLGESAFPLCAGEDFFVPGYRSLRLTCGLPHARLILARIVLRDGRIGMCGAGGVQYLRPN
jgi:hypothetical protein